MIDYDALLKEAKVHFSRSGGKGGQNVNKVETKVELFFNIPESLVLDDTAKNTLMGILHNRIDNEGILRVTASTERQQLANRKKAEQKLIKLIAQTLAPKKKRKATKPSLAAKKARLFSKRKHGLKKKERKKRVTDD